MIAITRDAEWLARLQAAAARGGWDFAVAVAGADAPRDPKAAARSVLVVDRAVVRGALRREVSGLRARFPQARIALAFTEAELGADGVAAGLASGADEVIAKSWPDERLFTRLAALRDEVLAAAVRVSADGGLKAEKRSHRVFHHRRGRWQELDVAAAEFSLLWALLCAEGETVTRERLLAALRESAGRDVESETLSRRALSLRRALKSWKGKVETVRGGSYRLVSSAARRLSTT
jgi:DNA-binding response OmpR family regulator